jgi:hypothetical protein
MSDIHEELSHEAIERDPWNAVYLRLPETPSPALLREAHWNTEYCYEAALARAENPEWSGARAFEPQYSEHGPRAVEAEHAKSALERLESLERLDPTLERAGPSSIVAELERQGNPIANENARDEDVDALEQRKSESIFGRPHTERGQELRARGAGGARTAEQNDGRAASTLDKKPEFEITDRMRRLLDQADREPRDNEKQLDRDTESDLSRDPSGDGRTRGR